MLDKSNPMDWGDLDDQFQGVDKETMKKASAIDQIFHGAYHTPEGKLLIEYLEDRYIKRYTVAAPGMDPLEVGIRQGRQSLVREILGAIERASTE